MERLIKDNKGLIWSIVKRFMNRGYEVEDLYQIGCMGFIKSIKRFDTNFEVKLSTYAVPYVLGEIKRFIRDDGPIKVSRSINENEEEIITNKLVIRQLMNELEDREKQIILLRFFKEKTQTEVANILGISQVQVSRIERKILNSMKEKLTSA